MVSGATPTDIQLLSPKNNIYVKQKSSIIVSATILGKLSDGTVITSQTIAVGTTDSSTLIQAPQPFNYLAISVSVPSVLSATNSISMTVVETRP